MSPTEIKNIPERERLIWEDANLRASLDRGIAQAVNGELTYLGSFAQYLEDDD